MMIPEERKEDALFINNAPSAAHVKISLFPLLLALRAVRYPLPSFFGSDEEKGEKGILVLLLLPPPSLPVCFAEHTSTEGGTEGRNAGMFPPPARHTHTSVLTFAIT